MTDQSTTQTTASSNDEKDEAYLDAGEATAREMRDAMLTMMASGAKMSQAYIDMRLSYLKLMRTMAEDPATPFGIMAKNLADISNMMQKKD